MFRYAMKNLYEFGISCAPKLLYDENDWHDQAVSFCELTNISIQHGNEFDIIGKLYSRAQVIRNMPIDLIGPVESEIDAISEHFGQINTTYTSSGPVYVVRIRKAVVWKNMIFVELNSSTVPLYENFRRLDRIEKGSDIASNLPSRNKIKVMEPFGSEIVFFGSMGSFNYGHWLTDDFGRYAALLMPQINKNPVTCMFSKLGHDIDKIRAEGVEFATKRIIIK